jgi:PKD repeat protein
MKNSMKRFFLAAVAGAMVASAHATAYNNDLLIGFTIGDGSGKDLLYDLGRKSTLTDGQTWTLTTLLTANSYNLNTVNWGVLGLSSSTSKIGWTTVQVPDPISGTARYNQFNTAMGTLYQNIPAAGAGNYVVTPAGDPSATDWYTETISGSGSTQDYVNNFGNPNVVGLTTVDLYEIICDGSDPVIIGNFTLAANGVVTYHTAGSTPAAPVAGFTGTPTKGFAPLQVVFTDASTGSITNWVWNFGDGHSVTNSAASNVTNTYANASSYTVTLTATGAGGASTNQQVNYVVASPTPQLGAPTLSSGKLVFSGANCPAGVQYRILTATNLTLPMASWISVTTNTFLSNGTFAYTNSATTNASSFYRLVSP